VQFQPELVHILPDDLPLRELVIQKASEHLDRIVEANEYMNLTRITTPREAAIKHVLDSLIPWRLFADARKVLDAGTGPGFPGIPLAIVLPGTRFLLAESIQKKARFVGSVLTQLELPNASISAARAEELGRDGGIDIITARALAPITRVLVLFAKQLKAGAKILLYKGPDAESEIAESAREAARLRVGMKVVMRYDLPDAMGRRAIVEITNRN
jgi:16S rRNA (guanine527-N7)-methyltransferase